MSSSTFKANLTVGGTAFDKSKVQLRRPTPDSDVLASSDDDKDHVRPPIRQAANAGSYQGTRRMSSSWLNDIQPRKNSLPATSFGDFQPSTPSLDLSRPSSSAFSWNTPSFNTSASGSRLREVVPSPTSAFAPGDRALPSPTTVDSDHSGIGFLLNNQQAPIRKSVRSQSYSIGQGDIENSPVGKFSAHLRSNLRHRPSKPSLLGGDSGGGLSQLREDDADEVESSNGSEHGVRLPAGYWEREQKQALLKQAAVENARTRNPIAPAMAPSRRKTTAGLRNASYGPGDYAIEEQDDSVGNMGHPNVSLVRRFSEHVSLLPRDNETDILDSPKKQQWATDNIPALDVSAMSRRHSFAHYGSQAHSLAPSTLSNTKEEEEEIVLPKKVSKSPAESDEFDAAAYFAGYGPASRAINASAISAAHPDPIIPKPAVPAPNPYAVPPSFGRPGRRLYVVTFKCSRAEVFYVFDNTGLEIRHGDLVIVDGDRGWDLGQVAHADVSLEEARRLKAALNEDHFRWLVMFSQYSMAGASNGSSPMLGALARAHGYPNNMTYNQGSHIGAPPEQDSKPKMIKRLAQQHEILKLRDKEGMEAKAKRYGAQKAADHRLNMEVLDVEYQADLHKLIFYYYAEQYVNFNELVTELFKQFKVRIWMSAINPTSVIPGNRSRMQAPSAIGPGAILSSTPGVMMGFAPVGPGFGNNQHSPHMQYGRGRQQTSSAFSQQMPDYSLYQAPNYPSWAGNGQQQSYMQQSYTQAGQYPNATASGSPMNYGGYYPPTTYGSSAAGSSFRGGYTSSYAGPSSYVTTAGFSSNPYVPTHYNMASYSAAPANGDGNRNGNGSDAASGLDSALMGGMQNMSFGAN